MYLYVVCIYIYGAEVCMKCLQLTYTTHTDTHNTIERMTNDVRWQPGCRYKILLRHCPHCNTCATWWRWHMQINCVHNNMHNKFMYFVSVLFRFVSNTPMNLHSNARSAPLYSVAVKMIYRGLTAHTSETPRARPPPPHNITHNRLVAIAYFTHSILACAKGVHCVRYIWHLSKWQTQWQCWTLMWTMHVSLRRPAIAFVVVYAALLSWQYTVCYCITSYFSYCS